MSQCKRTSVTKIYPKYSQSHFYALWLNFGDRFSLLVVCEIELQYLLLVYDLLYFQSLRSFSGVLVEILRVHIIILKCAVLGSLR